MSNVSVRPSLPNHIWRYLLATVIVASVGITIFAQEPPSLVTAELRAEQGKDSDQPKKKKKKDESKFRWEQHPRLVLGKGSHIDFTARLQGHFRQSDAPEIAEDVSSFDFARRRVGVEGVIKNTVDFQVEGELGTNDGWRDVFANFRRYEAVQVQGGQFKEPFGMEENTSTANLDFVYRTMASTRLAPGRDRGVMVHGRVLDRLLRYEAGVFNYDGKNARSNNLERVYGGQTFAARVQVQPFRHSTSPFSDFQIGVATTQSDVPEGVSALRARTVFGSNFFRPDLWVEGPRRRFGVEMRVRPGPASIKAEYIQLKTARRGQSVEDTDLSDFVQSGWYVSGTWVVTGENKNGGVDTPRKPLFQGGFGAVEVGARVEKLMFGSLTGGPDASRSPRTDVVFGNADRATTFGVNWYLNRWLKVQGNFIYQTLTDPAEGPLPSKPSFWSRVLRLQLAI